jgi:hypothetical protein
MMTDREILFRRRRPQINGDEAARLLQEYGEMVSMGAREALGDKLFLAFVPEHGELVGPLTLNAVVARELCRLLNDFGYGT